MATSNSKVESAGLQDKIASQFRGLNPNDPASWPVVPKALMCIALTAAIVAALWFAWLTNSADELETEQKKELVLREDYEHTPPFDAEMWQRFEAFMTTVNARQLSSVR